MKRRVISHYEFVRKIGAGGSGVVFLATDTLLQRPVVLKLLKRGALTLEQVRTTQLREARLASAIDHPNVCAIYDVGEAPAEDGEQAEAYIVMQFIPGKALDKIITEGAANLQLVLSAGIQIADGLSAAHSLGIFHRDLKPANVMLTEGGLIKILDFGLARRLSMDSVEFDPSHHKDSTPPVGATYTARGGTIAYMAPEQFVTGQSSVQSDIFALGLILYELATGRHPFHRPDAPEFQTIRATQYAEPTPLREINPALPVELESVIFRCLEKQPSARFASAADLREALKTIMMAMHLDSVGLPGEAITLLPSQRPPAVETPEEEKRTTGILSMLAERFRESGGPNQVKQNNSIVVLPFINFGNSGELGPSGTQEPSPLYGYALADAIAARLARVPSLVVRPSSALVAVPTQQLDPLAIGRKLLVQFVLAGNFLRSGQGFDLNWQLLDVPSQSVRAGGSINVATFDLVAVQGEICNEVFATLHGLGSLQGGVAVTPPPPSLSQDISEEYLQARAVLSSFMSRTGSREDLDRARELFESVTRQDVDFAPGWSGLGITHLQYASHGLGGQMHVLEARRAFDKALALDAGSVESNLYRVYMLLSRGEKESARHGIESLLQSAPNDWNVHLVAGQTLRIDGMYDEALEQFNIALRLNPSNAALIYNNRARVFQYQNQLELAADELEKGLTLEPKQPLLRISLGYQQMRQGDLAKAIETLETVTREATSLRIVYPTIALCYVQLGDREKAASFIVDETLSAAEADSEMAYRLATYFAVEGDESEALHWLRRAIYLGNENYPWFSINPAWRKLGGHADFERILEDLKKSYRRNQKNWRRLLAQVRD
jgi:serine/threonine-protein kinase